MSLPEPPRPDREPPPPPQSPTPKKGFNPSRTATIAIIVGSLIGVGVIVSALNLDSDGGGGNDGGTVEASGCEQPSTAWLDTLQSAFYNEYRDSAITSSAYVEADTSEGTAYYVAVNVDGVAGTAVFGTSTPPLQSDPGLMAGANPTANHLSDLGIDIPEGSPAGALLLDDGATSEAESCLSGSVPTGPTSTGSGATAAQTPTEQVKNAAIAQGYGDLALFSRDDVIDQTGHGLCRGARPLAPKLGNRLAPSMGEGFAKSYNESFGTNLSSKDGAAIVEIFLAAYCPEVL